MDCRLGKRNSNQLNQKKVLVKDWVNNLRQGPFLY